MRLYANFMKENDLQTMSALKEFHRSNLCAKELSFYIVYKRMCV